MGRRPNQPKRKFPGVSAAWSDGRWKWRALIRVDGRQVVGSLRLTQDEAYADRKRMEGTRAALPKQILMLGDAIDAAIAAARARGLPENTLTKTFRAHGNYLLKFWKAETPLMQIDAAEVEWFINEAGKSVGEDGEPKPARSKAVTAPVRLTADLVVTTSCRRKSRGGQTGCLRFDSLLLVRQRGQFGKVGSHNPEMRHLRTPYITDAALQLR